MLEAEARSRAFKGTTVARLEGIAGVVYPLQGADPRAVAQAVATVLGGRPPFRPEPEADPFRVLASLASDPPAAPSPAHGPWLLLTTEPAARHGPGGADWWAPLAAFRRPLLLVAAPRPGWEEQARAYGARARQGGIPLLGVVGQGKPHAPHFDPAVELGLPWLGCLPAAGGAPTAQVRQEQLWWLREQLWFRWWRLYRTEQVTGPPVGREGTYRENRGSTSSTKYNTTAGVSR
ncbi:MAG: hypothetical protein OXE74_02110 [Cyanobacteria bacterium MAG CAR2_bin_4]|nr:hypothetical protein [Cyanobacteria bacterium MAG CAR2_bin_4]